MTTPPEVAVPAGRGTPAAPLPAVPSLGDPARPMRVMLFKECSELAPWAVGAGAVFFGTLAIVFFNLSKLMAAGVANSYPPPTTVPGEVSASPILCPAIAGLFAWVQFFSETSTGRMALFLHRPITRTRMLLGKMFAALLLYLLAAGLPLAWATSWLASPDNAARPWMWSMALPFVADLFTGIPAYLAVMLAACRYQGRWHVPHFLPAVYGFAVCLLAYIAVGLVPALLLIVLATIPLAVAAVGLIKVAPLLKQRPLYAKVGQTFVDGCSLCILWIVALLLAQGAYRSVFPSETESTYVSRGFVAGKPAVWIYQSQGTRVFDYSEGRLVPRNLPPEEAVTPLVSLLDRTKFPAFYGPYRSLSAYIDFTTTRGQTRWIAPRGEGYILQYAWPSSFLLGTISPTGFNAGSKPPVDRFPGPLLYSGERYIWSGQTDWMTAASDAYFAAGDEVWLLDRNIHLVKKIFTVPSRERINVIAVLDNRARIDTSKIDFSPSTSTLGEGIIALATSNTLYFLSTGPDSRLITSYSDPRLNMENLSVGYYAAKNEIIIQSPRGPLEPWSVNNENTIVYLQPDGTSRIEMLPPIPLTAYTWNLPLAERSALAAAVPLPVGAIQSFGMVRLQRSWNFWAPLPIYLDIYPREEIDTLSLGFSFLNSGICALLAWILGRRFLLSRRALLGWTLAAFLLGIPGVVLLLITRGFPLRIRCPHCGKKRLASQPTCPHCAAAFPSPTPNGTEIFA